MQVDLVISLIGWLFLVSWVVVIATAFVVSFPETSSKRLQEERSTIRASRH